MSFGDRTRKSHRLITLLTEHYWRHPDISQRYAIFHEPYGYETHISPAAQQVLKNIYTPTSKHIRFTPDSIVGRNTAQLQDPVLLFEYKVTTTPRYTLGERQWNSGQIEADAWDTYMNLMNAGVRVALVIYCPYHPRPLLCEFPSNQWITHSRSAVISTRTGSATDYYNIALPTLRTFVTFMEQEFLVPAAISHALITPMLERAKTDPELQISHAAASPYRDRTTGFNWVL